MRKLKLGIQMTIDGFVAGLDGELDWIWLAGPDEAASRKAIAELDGSTVQNRAIKVNEARPKEERPARSDSDRSYNNGNSYNKNRY